MRIYRVTFEHRRNGRWRRESSDFHAASVETAVRMAARWARAEWGLKPGKPPEKFQILAAEKVGDTRRVYDETSATKHL